MVQAVRIIIQIKMPIMIIIISNIQWLIRCVRFRVAFCANIRKLSSWLESFPHLSKQASKS